MEKSPEFMQFDVIYTRQGKKKWWTRKTKWTRKAERKTEPIGAYTDQISSDVFYFEGEKKEAANRPRYTVNVKCDPIAEDYKRYEHIALERADKEFKKQHPKAEILP